MPEQDRPWGWRERVIQAIGTGERPLGLACGRVEEAFHGDERAAVEGHSDCAELSAINAKDGNTLSSYRSARGALEAGPRSAWVRGRGGHALLRG